MKEVILEVLKQLDKIEYVDTAEHLYDAVKCIKRHLDDDNLDHYIDDFLIIPFNVVAPNLHTSSSSDFKY